MIRSMGIVANEGGGGGGRGGEQKEIVFESLLPMYPFVPGCTIPQYVFKDVEKFSERVAVVDAAHGGDGRQYTYGQVHTLVRKFAAGLKREFGIQKGDVVLVLLPNVAEYSIFFLGIISAGAIFSGSNPAFHASEIQKQVSASDAKLILTSNSLLHKVKDCCHVPIVVTGEEEGSSAAHHGDQELAAAAAAAHSVKKLFEAADGIEGDQHEEDVVSMEDEDVCAMPFSSGTTGVSKGVMITHRNIVSNLTQTLADLERISFADMAKDGDLVVLGLMPFFHIYGISGILCATMRLKGRVIVMPRYTEVYTLLLLVSSSSSASFRML
jgi:4-coumarate--CoA ligase